MNDMEKQLNGFYREIAMALPQDGRKTFLPGIKAGIDSFLADDPDATIDDVISYFGTPECIANEYYAIRDGRQLTKESKTGKNIWMIVLVSLLLVVFIFAAAVLTSYVFHNYFDRGLFEYEVEVISQTEISPADFME